MQGAKLTRLNGDTSWLIEIHGKKIAIDPWLGDAPDVVLNKFFHYDTRVIPSSVDSLKQLGKLDAIIGSMGNPDHTHRETLLEADPSTPLYVAADGFVNLKAVKEWKHFDKVIETPWIDLTISKNWLEKAASISDKIKVFKITSHKRDVVDLHFALVLAFKDETVADTWQALIYTPHGIRPTSANLEALKLATPPIEAYVLLHGLLKADFPFFLGGTANQGGPNGLAICQKQPTIKYWLPTHDEEKKTSGTVTGYFQANSLYSFEDLKNKAPDILSNVTCRVLNSGESITLE